MSHYMNEALKLAQIGAENNEVPVGAITVDYTNDKIISVSANRMIELCDPTAHAEMQVIREACRIFGTQRLNNCDIYVTLEPCPMCAQAISLARIRRLYYGANDKKGGGVENGPRIFSSTSCNHSPEIYGGINEKECSKLLKDFFQEKR